jgi:phage-related protein
MLAVGAGVALGKLAKAFNVLRLAMAANPILLAVMVIIGLTILIIQNWDKVKKFLLSVWDKIKEKFSQLAEKIKSLAKSGFLGPVGWILTHWKQVINFFKTLPDRLGGYARSAGTAIWNGIKNGGKSVIGFVKGIANGYIGIIEGLVNRVIDGINKAIKLYNDIPLMPDMGLLGHVSLPRMATGGIVNGAQLAMIGEAGPEAVIPLSRKYRAQGADLYAKAGQALGMSSGGHTFNITNVGNALDEQQLASRMAWQLSTRSAV